MSEPTTLESLDKKLEGYRESTVKRFNGIEEKMSEEFLFVRARFDQLSNEMRDGFARVDERSDSIEAKLDDFMLMLQRIFLAKGQNPFAEGSDIVE